MEEHSLENDCSFDIINIGNNQPISTSVFLEKLERALIDVGAISDNIKNRNIAYVENRTGDVFMTYADTTKLSTKRLFKPNTEVEAGLESFAKWFVEYKQML